MRVLVVEPETLPYEKEIIGLEEMQATVGGLIDAIYPWAVSYTHLDVYKRQGRLPVLPKGLRRPGNPAAAAGGRGRALPAGWAGGCKGLLVGNAGRCVIFP